MDSWLGALSSFEGALVLTAVECIGDASAKLNGVLPVFASYNALAFILPKVLVRNPLGLVNGYWNAMTNITDLLIGAYLGERYFIFIYFYFSIPLSTSLHYHKLL
jgi:hypothetical protein